MSRRTRMTRKLSSPARNPARRARRHRPAAERPRAYLAYALGRAALDQAFGQSGIQPTRPKMTVPRQRRTPPWQRALQRRHNRSTR
jgi:hypothetical protein